MSQNLFTQVGEPIPAPTPTRRAVDSFLLDNHDRGTVVDFLRRVIQPDAELSIVSAYFTIYAFRELQSELSQIANLKFLFGEPKFIKSLDPDKTDKKAFQIEDSGIELSNRLEQKQVASECAEWIQEKVEIRSIKQSQLLHGKMYHVARGDTTDAIVGSSNFTQRGIGASAVSNLELNIEVDSKVTVRDLKAWFDDLWNDEKLVEDVKGKVLEYLSQMYVDHPPEFIYFKTLYHLFEMFLVDQESEDQRFRKLAIVETEIWKALYDFQRDGVKGAINKINAHNGCILADSVGLGKTYTALGVIKYYELRNDRVLVLCPKKLRENWTVYKADNNSELNPLIKDRFAYTVLSHTDVSRKEGLVGDINLAQINWGGYDLVVIDESHNFRNNAKGKRDEFGNVITRSRYEILMEDILKSGANTKVLLLSATPVNNDLKDLRNQVYFVTEGQDNAFTETFNIPSIRSTLANAQKTFTAWAKKEGEKDTKGLMDHLPAGFFTLLDELTIARSRKHLKRYYKDSLEEIGEFPKRAKPKSVSTEIDRLGQFMSYDDLSASLDDYQLSLYNPYAFLKPERKHDYEHQARNMGQENREKFLIGMMKVNFLKRLESSIHSFGITMGRTVEKIEALEAKLQRFQSLLDPELTVEDGIPVEMDQEDQDLVEAAEVGKALKYKVADLEVERWLEALATDRTKLEHLRDQSRVVTADRDAKFAKLKEIIRAKVTSPTTNNSGEPIDKLIVFTAFADTAAYLYENLRDWAQKELGVHIAMVAGGTRPNRSTFGNDDYTSILTNFSPRAKNRKKMHHMPQRGEISILIATDCISEGQNLQDCDLLVNYDIHWNPVRIIQRFGRIDRIGSQHKEIHLVNFWPTDNLNKYIKLKARVEARMALVDISATAEDNLLDQTQLEDLVKSDMNYRDKQLARLKDEILDLEDFTESPSLGEFTLDDFRMELANWIKNREKELREAPLGLYAVVPVAEDHLWLKPGAIFCLRQVGDTDGTETVNPLQPYYLVYIHQTGVVRFTFSQPKQVLDIMRDLCSGRTEVYRDLCDLFNQETENGQNMTAYSDLLIKAVDTILAQFNKRSIDGLLNSRGGRLVPASKRAKSIGDFELVTWLVIKTPTH